MKFTSWRLYVSRKSWTLVLLGASSVFETPFSSILSKTLSRESVARLLDASCWTAVLESLFVSWRKSCAACWTLIWMEESSADAAEISAWSVR